ncbi:5-oxoprolinase subunit PxpA [Endozoicomonas sp. SCSIO W0465]|uniref:5-oxoprolinase subunit PxpA n=1 Tax=Endozoicomonas sp. SCSIO W0465 TaxID=2918516 RepID=UPI002075F66C|nr:5-oxoprolinase subunit PxpA [Endozoicomonas sp. SCSIO W0465]USE35675.1 LamB/YcsF family protein [Endozoicomonas sp. SCSIO W0465]
MQLNCDMGESFGPWQMGNDQAVMPWIDMANIACGFHASDPDIMSDTVKQAVDCGVTVGAHPGYNDKTGFGRRPIPHAPESITQLVAYQVGALDAICQQHGTRVKYIKPHGALYHEMMNNPDVFEAMVIAAASMDIKPALMIQALSNNKPQKKTADRYRVPLIYEAYADRAYDDHGMLVSRSLPGAVHRDSALILEQTRCLLSGEVSTISGKRLKLKADSLCVHGDNLDAIALVQQIRQLVMSADSGP